MSSSQIFSKILTQKPQITNEKKKNWRIGNIEYFEPDCKTGSFAVGHTTKSKIEKFDDDSRDFIDTIDESGAYTFVIFDANIGLLAIAQKSKLNNSIYISRKIQELIQSSEIISEQNVDVIIDPIKNPDEFIQRIKSADSIKSFRATFTGPNPVDADELFQKPLSVYAKKMGAKNGVVEVKGESLNPNVVEAVANSTAATGNTASARIVPEEGEPTVKISMSTNAATVTIKDKRLMKYQIYSIIKKEYDRIRKIWKS